MKALLLAAGFGTRLRPLTLTVPKCMVPVGGKPLIDHWLDNLAQAEITDVRINTHHLATVVEGHLAQADFAGNIECHNEEVLLGTGGTLHHHIDFCDEEGLLVIHADNFCEHRMETLLAVHRQRPAQCSITMLAFRTETPQSCGILETDDDGIVIAFHEKVENPPGNLANGAVLAFDKSALDRIKSEYGAATDIAAEILPQFIGRIFVCETDGYFADIGTPEMLQKTNKYLTR